MSVMEFVSVTVSQQKMQISIIFKNEKNDVLVCYLITVWGWHPAPPPPRLKIMIPYFYFYVRYNSRIENHLKAKR